MTSFINLMASDVWSEADILARARAERDSIVPVVRQDELRTIMLGHIAQLRPASQEEYGEILQVAALTEQASQRATVARADMALLHQVLAVEAAIRRLALPALEPVLGDEPDVILNQAELDRDAAEREYASQEIDNALPNVHLWVALRNPPSSTPNSLTDKDG